jgi:hypothetical protein
MNKNQRDKECCYEEMTKGIGGQSQPSEYWNEPYENKYEARKWNSDGYDQSGMKGV